ncbi:MAG: pyridoxamine 5'-phosphate oxidase family protein [Candidatus Eremiobacteraeota bacterium]|nr:pyridoxamine 5'-phosphate oxidase family protein [Candidatus Eremiobacteraeota bacterium]
MTTPPFFHPDTRRADLAWTDWDEVRGWLEQQSFCRVAINDDPWPYLVAQTYAFTGEAFVMHFSRSGRLARLIRENPLVTVEVDEPRGLIEEPGRGAATGYLSVVARCRAKLEDVEIADGVIARVTAEIVLLSAKRRALPEHTAQA